MENEISNPKQYDPRMHTAEHILNQTMCRLFDSGRSVSSHIESKKSKCDYVLPQALTDEHILEIENQVNSIITSNVNVGFKMLERADAEKVFDLKRLPDSAGEVLRIVEIGDYDACPCSGVHVENTREIGAFKIISHNYENGRERIRFKLV
jgi:misacylated tRNA(Ala) deacylase